MLMLVTAEEAEAEAQRLADHARQAAAAEVERLEQEAAAARAEEEAAERQRAVEAEQAAREEADRVAAERESEAAQAAATAAADAQAAAQADAQAAAEAQAAAQPPPIEPLGERAWSELETIDAAAPSQQAEQPASNKRPRSESPDDDVSQPEAKRMATEPAQGAPAEAFAPTPIGWP